MCVTDKLAAFLRDFGTDEPRKGTDDGPLSCDEEPDLEELAKAVMIAVCDGEGPSAKLYLR